MKAFFLVKYGSASNAFQLREVSTPVPQENEVLVKVAAFGLNFTDVMSRKGMYKDAPPLPFIPGYEVSGIVESCGANVKGCTKGQKVLAFTRFGGYAEFVCSDHRAVVPVPENWDHATVTAFGTQYCTAYYAAIIAANIREAERVLINSAAGGVGTALVQLAEWKKAEIIGTCGSDNKLERLRSLGVDHPLNYNSPNFDDSLNKVAGKEGFDIVFDSVGGKLFRKCFRQLAPTGRIVGYGAASRTGKGLFQTLKLVLGFGFMHPAILLMQSRSVIGVNMLRVAERKPALLQTCLQEVIELGKKGILVPVNGGTFPAAKLAEAHELLASGTSIGKLCVEFS